MTHYSEAAWFEDFGGCCKVLLADEWVSKEKILEYYRSKYPDAIEANQKADLMHKAFSYLLKFDEKLEDAGLIVLGTDKKRNLVKPGVVHALYMMFVSFSDVVNEEPLIESVIQLARSQ